MNPTTNNSLKAGNCIHCNYLRLSQNNLTCSISNLPTTIDSSCEMFKPNKIETPSKDSQPIEVVIDKIVAIVMSGVTLWGIFESSGVYKRSDYDAAAAIFCGYIFACIFVWLFSSKIKTKRNLLLFFGIVHISTLLFYAKEDYGYSDFLPIIGMTAFVAIAYGLLYWFFIVKRIKKKSKPLASGKKTDSL